MGEARGKKRDFERAKIVFCPGVLGFATPIGSTSAHIYCRTASEVKKERTVRTHH